MFFERGHFQNAYPTNLNAKHLESFAFKEEKTISTVFLSHNHDDLEDSKEAAAIINMLEKNYNVKVYIDSRDPTMPKHTSGKTAARIKQRIKTCDKFLLLATDHAMASYWCNWELGVGDVYKYPSNIAVIPLKEKWESESEYKGKEYLQIYPSLQKLDGRSINLDDSLISQGYYIVSPTNKDGNITRTPLITWLTVS